MRDFVAKTEVTLEDLVAAGVSSVTIVRIKGFLAHARRQIDQIERRLLKGETIPYEEKVFSIFEEHTGWIAKGKAGTPVELGVPVAIVEDQSQFLLYHQILWQGATWRWR